MTPASHLDLEFLAHRLVDLEREPARRRRRDLIRKEGRCAARLVPLWVQGAADMAAPRARRRAAAKDLWPPAGGPYIDALSSRYAPNLRRVVYYRLLVHAGGVRVRGILQLARAGEPKVDAVSHSFFTARSDACGRTGGVCETLNRTTRHTGRANGEAGTATPRGGDRPTHF